MTVAEYMNLLCLCGKPRREHAHAYDDLLLPDGTLNPHPVGLRVVGITSNCQGFVWDLERELGGNPLENKHLRPLMVDGN